jgi:hypothetical protein
VAKVRLGVAEVGLVVLEFYISTAPLFSRFGNEIRRSQYAFRIIAMKEARQKNYTAYRFHNLHINA